MSDVPAPKAEASLRLRPVFVLGLVVLSYLAVYGQAVSFSFVWDDKFLVRDNFLLATPANLWVALKSDFWAAAGQDASGMFRPVVILTHYVERLIAGESPSASHTTNLVLHFVNAILLGAFLWKIGKTRRVAILSASLFAFHPAVVEAVANVSARTDPLVTFFLLCAAHLRLDPSSLWKEASAGLAILLALLSKEMALVSVPLLLLLDLALEPSQGWKRRVRRMIAPVVASVVYLVLRHLALGSAVPAGALALPGVRGWKPWDGPVVTGWYALHALFPINLGPVHSNPEVGAGIGLGCVVGFVFAIWCAKRFLGAPGLFAIVWFATALIPVAAWIPLQVRISDLFLYLPLSGAIPSILLGVTRVASKTVSWFWGMAGVLAVTSALQVGIWKDDLTLWAEAARRHPDNPSVLLNLGNALHSVGNLSDGHETLERAVRLAKERGDNHVALRARFSLCNILREGGRLDGASECYKDLLALSDGRMNEAWLNLGITRLALGDLDGASVAARGAIHCSDMNPRAYNLLGVVAANQRRWEEASGYFTRALEIAPGDVEVMNNLRRLEAMNEGTAFDGDAGSQ